MVTRMWANEVRKTLVCVDSYNSGILSGRFYRSYQNAESFESLSVFLMKMQALMDELQSPQAYTAIRSFTDMLQQHEEGETSGICRRGALATFELQILFRQHSSWQGVLIWREKKLEQSFRSVLELICLMDSALRDAGQEIAV